MAWTSKYVLKNGIDWQRRHKMDKRKVKNKEGKRNFVCHFSGQRKFLKNKKKGDNSRIDKEFFIKMHIISY